MDRRTFISMVGLAFTSEADARGPRSDWIPEPFVDLNDLLPSLSGRLSAADFSLALGQAAALGRTLRLPPGLFTLDGSVHVSIPSNKTLSVAGAGRGGSVLLGADPSGPVIHLKGAPRSRGVVLRDLSVGRVLGPSFNGQKTVLVENADNFVVNNVEVFGSLGFSLQFSRCTNGLIANNLVRDNVSGATDGIHLYKDCRNILITDNVVRDIGDDGISVGHGLNDGGYCGDILIKGNRLNRTNGIKIYGAVRRCEVSENTIAYGLYGVSMNTYEDVPGEAGDMAEINVHNNSIVDCVRGRGDQGAITCLWNTGSGIAELRNIRICDNSIINTRNGIVLIGSQNKLINNPFICNNSLAKLEGDAIKGSWIGGEFALQNNRVADVSQNGVKLTQMRNVRHIDISGNKFERVGLKGKGRFFGIDIREPGLIGEISNNQFSNIDSGMAFAAPRGSSRLKYLGNLESR